MRQNGFTLLELSIVIVIIGLIVAGISAGQSLVKQAQLRQVNSEISNYRVAFNSFKLQYDKLPGDMVNAYAYWGVAAGCTDALAAPGGTGCNGNGDGDIRYDDEGYRAWQHLGLAELVDGTFTGAGIGAGNNVADVGVNVPPAAYGGGSAGYSIMWDQEMNSFGAPLDINIIRFGAERSTWNTNNAVISAVDAYAIDAKYDDADPGKGQVFTDNGADFAANACTTGSHPSTTYDLSVETVECMMQFSMR